MLLFNTAPDSLCGKYAVLFVMRGTEATEKPTENIATMVANQWRVALSCELQSLLSEKNSLLHTFPQGMQSFSHVPMQTYPCHAGIYIGTECWEEVLELLPPAIEHVWSHGVHLLTQIWCQNDNSCPLCRNKNKPGSGWVQRSKVAY